MLKSNYWPIAAYLTMLFWLVVINHGHLGLNFNFTPEHYAALSQLDSIAHFTVTLSIGATFAAVYGWRWTLPKLIFVMVVWEILEMVTITFLAPGIFAQHGRAGRIDLFYVFDTMDDLAVGLAGALIGVFFNREPDPEPSNTAGA